MTNTTKPEYTVADWDERRCMQVVTNGTVRKVCKRDTRFDHTNHDDAGGGANAYSVYICPDGHVSEFGFDEG